MRFNRHDLCIYILFKILFIYAKQKLLNADEYDPTKPETTGGARGGGDENPQDYQFPDAPTQASDDRWKKFWEKIGAKPKDPYRYQKLPEDFPMSKLPNEKSGLSPLKGGEGTAETSSDASHRGLLWLAYLWLVFVWLLGVSF